MSDERISDLAEELLAALRANPDGLGRAALFSKTSAGDDSEMSRALNRISKDVIKLGNGKSTVYMLSEDCAKPSAIHDEAVDEAVAVVDVAVEKARLSNTVGGSPKPTNLVHDAPSDLGTTAVDQSKIVKFRVPKAELATGNSNKVSQLNKPPAGKSPYARCANLSHDSDLGLVSFILFNSDALLSTPILMKRLQVYKPDVQRSSVYMALSKLKKLELISSVGEGKNVCKGWKDKNVHPFDGHIVPTCTINAPNSPEEKASIEAEVVEGITSFSNSLQKGYLSRVATAAANQSEASKSETTVGALAKTQVVPTVDFEGSISKGSTNTAKASSDEMLELLAQASAIAASANALVQLIKAKM